MGKPVVGYGVNNKSMKILYDHQIFTIQKYGGISRYFYELMIGMKDRGHNVISTTKYSENEYAYINDVFRRQPFLSKFKFKGKKYIENLINERTSLHKLSRYKYDIFHATYHSDYYFNKLRKEQPVVITIHDLIHEKFSGLYPSHFNDTAKVIAERKNILKRADKIIAISQSTKNDIVSIYNIPADAIDVVYHGNSVKSINSQEVPLISEPYILFVGSRWAYKNFDQYLESVYDLLISNDIKLVCAGGGAFTQAEHRMFKALNIIDRVQYFSVNDKILANLYSNAVFFVFPSLYEGFGLPVLEAFGCSCPILLSNAGSLPEVGNDAVLYMDGNNKDDMRNNTELLLNDGMLRKNLVQKGLVRNEYFSWEKTVIQTEKIYQHALIKKS